MAHIKVTIGRARCGDFRDFLAEQKFKGRKIDYIESSGFLERDLRAARAAFLIPPNQNINRS
jgi:hypothetical protein